mmetsp:Transcript_32171/g.62930  ORF Transcript_32171/g.62930 Transcript_32171/m.62930 type:complete len:241 (-) Transcript_32171:350-1072(-)
MQAQHNVSLMHRQIQPASRCRRFSKCPNVNPRRGGNKRKCLKLYYTDKKSANKKGGKALCKATGQAEAMWPGLRIGFVTVPTWTPPEEWVEKDIVEMEGRVAAALRIGADGVKEAIYTVMECLWDCVSHSGPSPGNSGPAVQAAREPSLLERSSSDKKANIKTVDSSSSQSIQCWSLWCLVNTLVLSVTTLPLFKQTQLNRVSKQTKQNKQKHADRRRRVSGSREEGNRRPTTRSTKTDI